VGILTKPVWGNVSPSEVIGYKVVVVPKNHYESCWDFLVLLPTGDEEAEDIVLVRDMCELALRVGDTYSIYRLSQEEEDEYTMMPVMWFYPGDSEPSWMTPPNSEMH